MKQERLKLYAKTEKNALLRTLIDKGMMQMVANVDCASNHIIKVLFINAPFARKICVSNAIMRYKRRRNLQHKKR